MQEDILRTDQIAALGVGSNLALALRVLPQARRRDMQIFYAFCRVVDDLADEPHFSADQRRQGLSAWREALSDATPKRGEPVLAPLVRDVLRRHAVPLSYALEVVAGCEMDLGRVRYQRWEDLKVYCYRVASAVGLVSARIFGASDCEAYAVDLGFALQLTNILRDSAEDYRASGRIYLPMEEMDGCGVREGEWCRSEPGGWESLMRLQSRRARGYFESARRALPSGERTRMVAAEMMGAVYEKLLTRMEEDGFRVWSVRYRLGRIEKLRTVSGVFWRVMCGHLRVWESGGQRSGLAKFDPRGNGARELLSLQEAYPSEVKN